MAFDIPPSTPPVISVRIWPKRVTIALLASLAIALALLLLGVYLLTPPRSFPSNTIITIPQGTSAKSFGATLENEHVIRSSSLFYVLARISGLDRHLDTGAYVFKTPLTLPHVLWRTAHAEHGIEAVRVTITEGMTRFDIAQTLSMQLPGFDAAAFLRESSTSEGYLFPETYLFMPSTSAKEIVLRLKSQFSQSIQQITPQILASKHSFKDAIIIASILEREAKTPQDMRIVAGILWNRITSRMPLQVDAAFGYARQQNGYTPTAEDLVSDSPYNTYKYKGLPPTPISNPGLAAIEAAVQPASTKYFYYLTGTDNQMHYAVTFAEHVKNKTTYLK